MFAISSYRTLTHVEKRRTGGMGAAICIPPLAARKHGMNYCLLTKRGVVARGATVKKGDVIIGRMTESGDASIAVKSAEEEGVVDSVHIYDDNANAGVLVKIVVRAECKPEVGDKYHSLGAQKGVCGLMLPQWDMPFTQSGMVPDLIINTHCIPSRMTINQLMESVLGKTCVLEGRFGDATAFTTPKDIAEKLCDGLRKHGFEGNGNEELYNGFTGEPMDARIFIGPVYYNRLKHMVKAKMHVRAQGAVTTLTRQPLEGRSKDGGLRFGEMERDALIGQGAARFLKERLFDMSDPYVVHVCSECGGMTQSDTGCKCGGGIVRCNMPYACKLLVQELNAMSVRLDFKTT